METKDFCAMILILGLCALLVTSNHFKNLLGSYKGYGGCYHCGGTWDWTAEHVINYSEREGMFPLCVNCFRTLPLKKIKFYIEKHVRRSKDKNPEKVIAAAVKRACEDRIKDGPMLDQYDAEICSPYIPGGTFIRMNPDKE